MKYIVEAVLDFLKNAPLPDQMYGNDLIFEDLRISWGVGNNPKFDVEPSFNSRWGVYNLDEEVPKLAISYKNSEPRNIPLKEEEKTELFELLDKRYKEWNEARYNQIMDVLNGSK